MKGNLTFRLLFSAALVWLSVMSLQARDMVALFKNGTSESYPLSELMRIKFTSESMVAKENTEGIGSCSKEDIQRYYFEGSIRVEEVAYWMEARKSQSQTMKGAGWDPGIFCRIGLGGLR